MNEGAPIQGFDIPVSALSIAHLNKICANVDGAFVLCQSTGTYWSWVSSLPAGLVSSTDGSSGATTSSPGGFWVNTGVAPSGGASVAQAQTRYVSKGGNDATGDGSFAKPFLTIQAAINSITDASTAKPYVVFVGPGVYATTFKLKNGVFVVGAGAGPGEYTGSPLLGATTIAPDATQLLDASFAGAGNTVCGIKNCTCSSAIVANFSAIGSTGAGTITLQGITTESAVTLTGTGAQSALVRDLYINSAANFTVTDIGLSDISNFINDFGGGLIIQQAGAFQGFHSIVGVLASTYTFTWTSAAIGNFMLVDLQGMSSTFAAAAITITGAGALVVCGPLQSKDIAMPDSNQRLSFGDQAAGTLIGLNCGINIVSCTPTVNRTLTIDRSAQAAGAKPFSPTTIIVRNLSTGFVIDFTFPAGTNAAGNASYVPPASEVSIIYDVVTNTWMVRPILQSGVTTLAAGVSPAIAADISANSRIVATLKTKGAGNSGNIINAKAADRVNGTRAGGGSFKLTAVDLAGATVATDTGDYDWHIAGG